VPHPRQRWRRAPVESTRLTRPAAFLCAQLLSEIRRRGVVQAGHGVPLTAPAVNLVVDAWCRTGNMHRAEALVAEMERRHFKKWGGDPREDRWWLRPGVAALASVLAFSPLPPPLVLSGHAASLTPY
jgi:pentatricopeptide repeat protein